MNVVGHQAPRPDLEAGGARVLAQEPLVEGVVVRAEEHLLAAVAALGNVVQQAGGDDAGETGHAARVARDRGAAQLGYVSPQFRHAARLARDGGAAQLGYVSPQFRYRLSSLAESRSLSRSRQKRRILGHPYIAKHSAGSISRTMEIASFVTRRVYS
ncbi:hypothetical protein SH611_14595 [Geminicoccaceae bacterium 1502E]|nr:hypothetical protein [Geminicoccaceae bacterium 1502E]